MGLKDYEVKRDKFENDDTMHFSFPCACCFHRHRRDSEEPCRTCDHNANAEPE